MADDIFQFSGSSNTPPNIMLDTSNYTRNWTYLPNHHPCDEVQHCTADVMQEEPLMSRDIRWTTEPRDGQGRFTCKRRITGVKRKGPEECAVRRGKVRATVELMAARMSGLCIDSLDAVNASRLSESPVVDPNKVFLEDVDEDDQIMTSVESTSRTDDVRLELSDFVKEKMIATNRRRVLPELIAEKIANPCTELVLWEPPRTLTLHNNRQSCDSTTTSRKETEERSSEKIPVWNLPDNATTMYDSPDVFVASDDDMEL